MPPGAQVEVNRPSNLLSDSDAGVQLSTFWGGWDLTLNYFYHYSDTPVFETVPTGPNQVKVRQRYERSHLVGGSFSNAFGDLTLRGEVVFSSDRYFATRNLSDSNGVVRTNEIAYVLGFDWYGFRESLVSLQLFQSALTSHRSGVIRDRIDSVVTLLLRRELWNDRLLLESIWLHDVNQDDGLLRPKVEYEIRDGVKAWAGFDWFYGSRNGVFGQFDGEDRLVLGFEVGL